MIDTVLEDRENLWDKGLAAGTEAGCVKRVLTFLQV